MISLFSYFNYKLGRNVMGQPFDSCGRRRLFKTSLLGKMVPAKDPEIKHWLPPPPLSSFKMFCGEKYCAHIFPWKKPLLILYAVISKNEIVGLQQPQTINSKRSLVQKIHKMYKDLARGLFLKLLFAGNEA